MVALPGTRNSGIRTIDDLIAKANASDGVLHFGSFGVGSGGHLAMEFVAKR